MIRRRTLVSLALTALVLGVPASASAGLPSAPDARVTVALAAIDQRLAPVRERADAIRSTLARGTVLSVVRAAAMTIHQESVVDAVRPTGRIPATLGQAVRSISTAVGRADRMMRTTRNLRLAKRFPVQRAFQLSFELLNATRVPKGIPLPSPVRGLRAAATMATAIDRAMPALQRAAAAMPAPARSATAPGCDVIDQSPNLCVGGPGNNEYDSNETVSIDLAGDDIYRNNAGGMITGAALAIDLSGNDTYDATGLTASAAQGSGTEAVGMLLDGAGNDTYRESSTGGVTGGQGLGFFGGAGFLIDGTGSDTFSQDSQVSATNAGAAGEGEGFFGGVAALVNGGVGDDTYSMHAVETPVQDVTQDDQGNLVPVTIMGNGASAAQGVGGFGGGALFSDTGGNDSLSVDVRVASAPADGGPVQLTFDPAVHTIQQFVQSAGQGEGVLGGGSYLLEGPGDTTYVQRAVMEPVPLKGSGVYGNAAGQGNGPTGTVAVLSDPGGNDTYSVTVGTVSAVQETVSDTCACADKVGADIGQVHAQVQGYGANGEGVLDDGGGNDTFSLDLSSSSNLSVRDERSDQFDPVSGSAVTEAVVASAQGMAGGAAGSGVLANVGGDDTYTIRAVTSAHVDGSSSQAGHSPDLVPTPASVTVIGQGAGTLNGSGALIDIGGSDSYATTALASSTAGTGDPEPGDAAVHVQGAVNAPPSFGFLADLDGTGTDSFAQTPAEPACTGTRGQGVWRDCANLAVGVNT